MKYQTVSLGGWLFQRKRLLAYILSFVVVVGVQTVLYWWGMATLEDDPRTLLESLEIIVQSLTTTGYGQDAPWESSFLLVLSIIAQFTGVAYLFIAFPLFVGPWIRDAIEKQDVPESIVDAEDHIIVGGYSSLSSSLVEDLEARGHPYVILEDDEELALGLYNENKPVVHGSATSKEALERVHVENARAYVIDTTHHKPIETILSIKEFGSGLQIVCLVDEPEQTQYLRFAGATTVLSPKHRLGKSVADKAQNTLSSDIEEFDDFDTDLETAEFPVNVGTSLIGRPLSCVEELEETGVRFVGAWIRGEFVTTISSQNYIDENTVLVLAGTSSQLDLIEEMTDIRGRTPTSGPVLIAGFGPVGMTADGILRKAGRSVTTIDSHFGEDVDIVGDATEIGTLREAGIDEADTIIIAVTDDETAILSTLVAREANPDIEIIVAANDVESTSTLYSAGADYVLALPKVAGRMATLDLFDKDVLSLRDQIRLVGIDAQRLEGKHPRNDDIGQRTDAKIIAVKRDDEVITEFDHEFTFDAADEVVVAGTDEGVTTFKTEVAN